MAYKHTYRRPRQTGRHVAIIVHDKAAERAALAALEKKKRDAAYRAKKKAAPNSNSEAAK